MDAFFFIAGEATDWGKVGNGIGLILTGIFACTAAFSSLKNGRTLRENGAPKPPAIKSASQKKAASPEDWYER